MSAYGLRSGVRSGEATSKLLAKVSRQLSGGYNKSAYGASDADRENEDGEDGLSSYLKLLSQKTSQESRSGKDNDESDDEIKLTQSKPQSSVALSSNRFLKKPITSSTAENSASASNRPVANIHKKATEKSPSLNKVEAFTKKLGGSKQIQALEDLSDSDLELDLSMDEDVLADINEMKKSTLGTSFAPNSSLKFMTKLSSPNKPASAQDKSKKSFVESDEEALVKIGKSGNRFLKKANTTPNMNDTAKTPENFASPTKGKPTASAFTVQGADSHSAEIGIDTDDESLAEFIGGLSNKSSEVYSKTTVRSEAIQTKKKKHTDVTNEVDESLSEIDTESLRSDLQKSSPRRTQVSKENASGRTTFQESHKESYSYGHKKENSSDILDQFGLQTVEDLLGVHDSNVIEPIPIPESQYESDFDIIPTTSRGVSPMPLRSILSPTPRSLTPKSSRSRVRLMDELTEVRSRSPSPEVPVTESRISVASKQEIPSTIQTATDSESETRQVYGSDTEEASTLKTLSDAESVSSFDRMSVTRTTRHKYRRKSSLSRRSSTASERFYSDDFSGLSQARDSESTSRRSSYTDDLESDRSTSGSAVRSKHRSPKVVTKDCEVQTGLDTGLHYHWVFDLGHETLVNTQYRQAFAEPAPISATVISAEALHALTNYSPATMALNDMLRQQSQLLFQFVNIQKRLHQNVIESLDLTAAYKYTTLQETMEYIRKHRSPVASFEETLEQVKQEMGII